LGWYYDTGHGAPQDYTEAVHWYRKAAEQGWADAQFNLGLYCVYGRGVPKNPVVAYKWFRLAAEQSHPGAKEQFAALTTLLSHAELAASKRLYEEFRLEK
jgi:TPR repeat protein